MEANLTIWCISDCKPGHTSQIRGLVAALGERRPCRVQWLTAGSGMVRRAKDLHQRPDLILCAGHRTHLHSIHLKWRFGGALMVLMKPSLPRQLFNLCIIPQHDTVRASRRVLLSCGTLTDIQQSRIHSRERGLILLGGPSRHHRWDDSAMLQQVQTLCQAMPATRWTLTTSRRTPDSFVTAVSALANSQLLCVPAAQTNRDWLLQRYAESGVVWVSEDSASMVYEGLSAGAQVGVLPVARKQASRVSCGLDQLLQDRVITSLADFTASGAMHGAPRRLREAQRVADYIDYWLQQQEPTPVHESPAGFALPQ